MLCTVCVLLLPGFSVIPAHGIENVTQSSLRGDLPSCEMKLKAKQGQDRATHGVVELHDEFCCSLEENKFYMKKVGAEHDCNCECGWNKESKNAAGADLLKSGETVLVITPTSDEHAAATQEEPTTLKNENKMEETRSEHAWLFKSIEENELKLERRKAKDPAEQSAQTEFSDVEGIKVGNTVESTIDSPTFPRGDQAEVVAVHKRQALYYQVTYADITHLMMPQYLKEQGNISVGNQVTSDINSPTFPKGATAFVEKIYADSPLIEVHIPVSYLIDCNCFPLDGEETADTTVTVNDKGGCPQFLALLGSDGKKSEGKFVARRLEQKYYRVDFAGVIHLMKPEYVTKVANGFTGYKGGDVVESMLDFPFFPRGTRATVVNEVENAKVIGVLVDGISYFMKPENLEKKDNKGVPGFNPGDTVESTVDIPPTFRKQDTKGKVWRVYTEYGWIEVNVEITCWMGESAVDLKSQQADVGVEVVSKVHSLTFPLGSVGRIEKVFHPTGTAAVAFYEVTFLGVSHLMQPQYVCKVKRWPGGQLQVQRGSQINVGDLIMSEIDSPTFPRGYIAQVEKIILQSTTPTAAERIFEVKVPFKVLVRPQYVAKIVSEAPSGDISVGDWVRSEIASPTFPKGYWAEVKEIVTQSICEAKFPLTHLMQPNYLKKVQGEHDEHEEHEEDPDANLEKESVNMDDCKEGKHQKNTCELVDACDSLGLIADWELPAETFKSIIKQCTEDLEFNIAQVKNAYDASANVSNAFAESVEGYAKVAEGFALDSRHEDEQYEGKVEPTLSGKKVYEMALQLNKDIAAPVDQMQEFLDKQYDEVLVHHLPSYQRAGNIPPDTMEDIIKELVEKGPIETWAKEPATRKDMAQKFLGWLNAKHKVNHDQALQAAKNEDAVKSGDFIHWCWTSPSFYQMAYNNWSPEQHVSELRQDLISTEQAVTVQVKHGAGGVWGPDITFTNGKEAAEALTPQAEAFKVGDHVRMLKGSQAERSREAIVTRVLPPSRYEVVVGGVRLPMAKTQLIELPNGDVANKVELADFPQGTPGIVLSSSSDETVEVLFGGDMQKVDNGDLVKVWQHGGSKFSESSSSDVTLEDLEEVSNELPCILLMDLVRHMVAMGKSREEIRAAVEKEQANKLVRQTTASSENFEVKEGRYQDAQKLVNEFFLKDGVGYIDEELADVNHKPGADANTHKDDRHRGAGAVWQKSNLCRKNTATAI